MSIISRKILSPNDVKSPISGALRFNIVSWQKCFVGISVLGERNIGIWQKFLPLNIVSWRKEYRQLAKVGFAQSLVPSASKASHALRKRTINTVLFKINRKWGSNFFQKYPNGFLKAGEFHA